VGSLKSVFVVALLLALALAACFTASFTDGTVKCSTSTSENRLCPGGSTCVNGLCYHDPDLATPILDLSGTFGDDLGRDLSSAD
jgi:hypothetical protein